MYTAVVRTCFFCKRWFRNKQAVRAHLQWCEPYLELPERDDPAEERQAGPLNTHDPGSVTLK